MKILIIIFGLLIATTVGADRGEVTVRLPRAEGKPVDVSNPSDVGNTYEWARLYVGGCLVWIHRTRRSADDVGHTRPCHEGGKPGTEPWRRHWQGDVGSAFSLVKELDMNP